MPHKVGFRVAYVSGEDEKFRAKELNTHGPTVQGWHSPKFCIYPQEVIIQLESRTKICKIQVLSHQSLVATQIELHVGDIIESSVLLTPQNAKYQKLGSVALSDNERTNYKARELKSVHVDAIGIFVKFVIHKNHVNRHNLCNQVGIVAVNVIGDVYDDKSPSSEDVQINGNATGLFQRRPDFISPLDDLAFDMYQDPEVALIIRKLDARKQQSVLEEQYDFARRLKNAILELHKAGEKLGKYEIEKRQATDMEDYEKARQKQQQMEEYRMRIYTQLELHKLVDNKFSSPREPLKEEPAEKPFSPDLLSAKSRDFSDDEDGGNTFEDYENRTIPTLRKRNGLPEELPEEDDSRPLKPSKGNLSDRDRREANLPIDVFGMKLVENAYAKSFSERIQALKAIQRHLRDFNPAKSEVSTAKIFRASVFLVMKALKDNVLTVFTQSLNVLTTLLRNFPEMHKLSKNELSGAVDKVLPELISRSGDNSPRIRTAAMNYILTMTDFPEISQLHSVANHCCRPIQSNVTPRLAQSRAELVEQLVMRKGVDKTGLLTIDTVMNFCVPALEHPLGPVREIAEHVIVHLYQLHTGREIRRYLPPDDEKPRRNIIYRQLFETMDKIDEQQMTRNKKDKGTLQQKQSKAKKTQPRAVVPLDRVDTIEDDIISLDMLDKTCIFCGETSDDFTDEGLDLHYWKACPMLVKCKHCRQVVEIASLTHHHLNECAAKDHFLKCDRCQEAVDRRNYEAHVRANSCTVAKSEKVAAHCPLCHQNILPGEENWKNHLTKPNGCPCNCRRNKTTDDGALQNPRAVIVVNDKAGLVSDRAATLPRSVGQRKSSTMSRMSRSNSQKLTASSSTMRKR